MLLLDDGLKICQKVFRIVCLNKKVVSVLYYLKISNKSNQFLLLDHNLLRNKSDMRQVMTVLYLVPLLVAISFRIYYIDTEEKRRALHKRNSECV